ncbi:MAG: hypothetical protein WKF33_01375 [Thermoleophilaceae bacterium]
MDGENLAAVVRENLAAARERGEGFDAAWSRALADLPLERPRRNAKAQRREIDSWGEALAWARPAFRRAYYREPVEGAEDAAAALAEAA